MRRTTAYGGRDYTFGQAMLTLRAAIGLTQAGLANYLGVSRRAVGEWEAGSSYPKAEHLKKVIALGVKQQAFPSGHEAEAIRALWKAARQKMLLDEHWLSSLLGNSRPPHLHLVPSPVAPEASPVATVQGQTTVQGQATAPTARAPAASPLVDWDDALGVPIFYGREEEVAQLTQWVVQEHCRLVSVLGIGGIGKSALAIKLMRMQADHFKVVIFRSLRDAPSCDALLDDCLQVLSPQSLEQGHEGVSGPAGQIAGRAGGGTGQVQDSESAQGTIPTIPVQGVGPLPTPTERRISLLLSLLSTQRVLLVLDNLEGLLEAGDVRGKFRPGFEGYGQLLRRVAETGHQSCLLFTSREKPAELRSLEGKRSLVFSLRLAGLDVAACKQLLVEKAVVGTDADQEYLIERYGGNPLALKIVAETIVDLMGGEIGAFFTGDIGTFGSVTDLLDEQFARLSALEKTVLRWLAIIREPVTIGELLAVLVIPVPRVQVLEAIDAGYRRSLIERGKRSGSFTLQSVVLEYVTALLVMEASHEIQEHRLDRLRQHGLSLATAREYVRQTQERLLLSPLLANLQHADLKGVNEARTGPASVQEQLLLLLDQLRSEIDSVQGYGPANLIALLRLLRGNLNGLDLSKLCIFRASLQGIQMQGASLAGALIHDTVFTEAVSATWCVAVSQDGTLWAASGMQGMVRVWREGGQTLHLIWQAHTDMVQALAFSPDGRTLASGSVDGTVKLWDVEASSHAASPRAALLWQDWHNCPQTLAFSPDGSLLVCSGLGATVRLWETQSGTNLQNLEHPAHVFIVAWSPDGKLLASACCDGLFRLWERREPLPLPCTEVLRLSTSWETGPLRSLAFAPDGRTLASSGWEDRKVKLWEVESGRLLHTFEGETTGKRSSVVWSPDGRTLACCSYEKTIRVFDVEQRRHRAVLSGHTSNINGMAFTPDSNSLLSTGDDGTLRVWDVLTGQCVRVMQGYAVSLYSLDWSPDGMHLVSGGTDGLVTIWDLDGETPPRELRGHAWLVWGVGWSPDGKLVASASWDTVIRLWNPASHTSVQVFEDLSTSLTSLAWSPDGSLLAVGTFLKGMYVWDVKERRPRWVGEPDQNVFLSAAWSPDGSLLAGGSDDGSVYLWDGANGMRRERLPGHHGLVNCVAWSPDGRLLVSGSGNRGRGELFVWDVQIGDGSGGETTAADRVCRYPACMQTCDAKDGIGARHDQCGTTGLDQSSSGPSHLLSRPIRTFAGHSDMIYTVAWSRSRTGAKHSPCGDTTAAYCSCGDWLISGGVDGRLCWWDLQSGGCVRVQSAHRGTIRSLKVSPDGRWLASCGDDGTILIWDLCSDGQAQGTGSAQGDGQGPALSAPTAPPLLRTLRRDRPYERLNITGISGLTEAQKTALRALGAIEQSVL